MSAQNTTRGSGARGSKQKKSAPRRAPRNAKPNTGTVRERQAAQRALVEARRAREGRARRLWIVLAPIAVAVLAVTVLIAVKAASNGGSESGKGDAAADPTVLSQVTNVPTAAFDAVGAGKPTAVPSRVDGAPLTADGKPRVLYIGAEYCPFCAVERWPMIIALSRFGTWDGLRYAFSAPSPEVYPDTATFTFHGATYTSKWLSFTGIETHTNRRQGNGWEPLDTLGGADLQVFQSQNPDGATPFVDLGGKFVIVGATYDPELVAKRTQAQIAGTLADPKDKTGAGVTAAANVLTAALCELTNGQPANVCTSPGVTAAAKVLP